MAARIAVVFGTRPEAIKMLPLVRELRSRSGVKPVVIVTGQHRQMLDQVLAVFGERVDVDLDVMASGQTLLDVTTRVMGSMTDILRRERFDLVLVHGDTTTAMAAATAAFYERVPIGHVEAGLRSGDIRQPWPEEFNRIAIDAVSDFCFAPTERAAANLRRESDRDRVIAVTGNTGIDALMYMASIVDEYVVDTLDVVPSDQKRLILVTGHRRENFGRGFEEICESLIRISRRKDVEVFYPVHLNPNVSGPVRSRLLGCDNVHLMEPVDYIRMVALLKRAYVVLTDSGGIQEEGPALGKPVLVMRNTTERPEAVETGVVSLVGTDPSRICAEVDRLLDDADYYRSRARVALPYGDGSAARKIADVIEAKLLKRRAA